MDNKLKKLLKVNGCSHLIDELDKIKPKDAKTFSEGIEFVLDNWDCSPNGGVLYDIIKYLKEKSNDTN